MALAQLGQSAVQLFNEGNYESSLEHLEKIRQQKEDDLKVEHNVAIGQYLRGGSREPRQLLETLAKIKSRIEEAQHDNENDAPYVEEDDTSLLTYNEAVMYFQLKQHATSTLLLEQLFCNIEPIEEGLAVKICFLLLDNYWLLKRTAKAAQAIAFLDRIQEQAGEEATWTPNADKPCACPESIDMRNFELRLHMHKAQYHLLNQSFRSSKKEIKQALNVSSHSSEAMLLKANFEFLRRNYRKSLKLLHTVSKSHAEQQAAAAAEGSKAKVSPITPAIHNNAACIHFSLNNYNAALWYLSRALKASDTLAHQSAQSAAQGAADTKAGSLPVQMFAHCHKSEVLYNSGLQQLLLGRPEEAFTCFQEASMVLFHLPRLWLRLAECCIAHNCIQERELRQCQSGDPLCAALIDSGRHQKMVLPVNPASPMPPRGAPVEVGLTIEYALHCARNALHLSRPVSASKGAPAADGQGDAAGNVSALSGAAVAANSSQSGWPGGGDADSNNAECSAEHARELKQVRVHSLVALSYCSLCLLSPEVALTYSQQLIAETGPASTLCLAHRCDLADGTTDFGEIRLLGHSYAAEALVVMNRVSDALAYVNPSLLADQILQPETVTPVPVTKSESKDRGSDDEGRQFEHPELRCQMYVNIATVMATNGDFDKAEQFAQQALAALPGDHAAQLLQIYLQLQKGDKDGALSSLQMHRTAAVDPAQAE